MPEKENNYHEILYHTCSLLKINYILNIILTECY